MSNELICHTFIQVCVYEMDDTIRFIAYLDYSNFDLHPIKYVILFKMTSNFLCLTINFWNIFEIYVKRGGGELKEKK